jgi:TonB-linked SusC/RagA family outer membrane protein
MKKFLLLCSAVVFAFSSAWAQERTVSGKVTSLEDGSPLPGVNVVIKGTTNGTVTDADGNFKLSGVSASGGALVFSFIGLQTQEVVVGDRAVVDVSLSLDVTQLSEVVVTGLGIEKEKKALAYQVTTVGGDAIAQKPETDVGRLLRGKVAGANITQTSGVTGSATNIILRGYTSISGSNQPLWVVDGVPFDGGTNSQDDFQDGQTESSRFLDLDPNNIESINVLTSLSSTVVYGDRGRNGVILVTTKNGSSKKTNKKNEVSFTQSYFLNEIASLPEYSKKYGNGFHQAFGNFFSNWGPDFNELGLVAHPLNGLPAATQAVFPDYVGSGSLALYEYQAYDNVSKFFRKGRQSNSSISFRGSTDKVSYSVSYSHSDETGFTPGNELVKDNFGFGGNAKLNNKINVGATFNYAKTNYKTPPIASSFGSGVTGGGSSIFGDIFYTPRNNDLMNWPYQNPVTGASVYYRGGNDIQNPRWTAENAKVEQDVDRIFGNAYVDYNPLDWLNVKYRIGLDNYTEFNSYGQHRGGVDGNINGLYRTVSKINTIVNQDFIVTANKELSENLTMSALVGFNTRRDTRYEQGVESSNQIVFGVFRHFNFVDHNSSSTTAGDLEFEYADNRLGLYGQFQFAYKNFAYLTIGGRNDWTNTTEEENNALFYPSVEAAFDATSAISALQNSSILNYLKARVNFGNSARFPAAYTTRNTLNLASRTIVNRDGSVSISNSVANRLGNPDLKPERIQEIEVGLDSRWWNDRISLDVAIFKKNTVDLIVDRALDPSTGYTVQNTNAGELEVKGIQIQAGVDAVRAGDFAWNIRANFGAIRNTIVDLPEGITELSIAGFTNIGNFAIEGQPYGVIQGPYLVRDAATGKPRTDATGAFIVSNDIKILGNPNPDWTSSLTNSFTYKGIRLSAEWQYQHGGDVYSRTAANLVGRGVTAETDDFDRRTAYVLDGIGNDGQLNTVQMTATNVYFENIGFGADELKIWDATTIRLNEVSLGYSLPGSLLSKTPFGAVSINVTGNNLWYKAVNFPEKLNFDPNAIGTGVGNGQGLDFLSGPSARRYGVSLNLTF